MLIHKQAGNQTFLRSQRTWERPETQVVQERSRDEWLTKGQVQSFFCRLSAISRKKRADQSREWWNLWRSRFALSALARRNCVSYWWTKRRKEVEDIFNIQPIRYDGHDICEKTNQEVISKFNVKTSANILNCSNKYNHRHVERMQLLPHHPVNGQGLANCHIVLGGPSCLQNSYCF